MTRPLYRWFCSILCALTLSVASPFIPVQAQTPPQSAPQAKKEAEAARAKARAKRKARKAKAATDAQNAQNARDAQESQDKQRQHTQDAKDGSPARDAHPALPVDTEDTEDTAHTAPTAGQAAPAPSDAARAATTLPAEHTPKLQMRVQPEHGVKVGEVAHVEITADVPVGDDVTITDQSFAPFEVYKKDARVEQPGGDRQRFVFALDLLALAAGDTPIPAITLRVVTQDNSIGSVATEAHPYKVQSLIANEPNAQPKDETAPVAVLEDNYLPIYILGGLLAALVIAGLTLLVSRYLQRRKRAAIPPPPPRPPWEVAVEALAKLRTQKQPMLDAGQGGVFVDQLSDVVRAYLGGRFAFDGLETTTDEMITQLQARGAALGLTQEVAQFLGRCDLVKFAKVEPDGDEVDLLFAKAQDLVQLSEPERLQQSAPNDPAHVGALQPAPPRRPQRPDDGGSSS